MTDASKKRKLDRLHTRTKKIALRKVKAQKQWRAAEGKKKARLAKKIHKLELRLRKMYDRMRKIQATPTKGKVARKKTSSKMRGKGQKGSMRQYRAETMKIAKRLKLKAQKPKKPSKKKLIPPVSSIRDLQHKASSNPYYLELALMSARNLGGSGIEGAADLGKAIRWLEINAMETSEEGVVDEINACRDLIASPGDDIAPHLKPKKASKSGGDGGITEDEWKQIVGAAHRTYQEVGGDLAQLVQESEGRDYLKVEEVIETVLDAGRIVTIGGLSQEIDKKLDKLSYEQLVKLFKKKVFLHKRYD